MKTKLLRFISDEILSGRADFELQSSDDLLTSELVDSMGMMRIIEFIEQTSGQKIPPEDVTIENFVSVDAICSYLTSRT